MARLFLSFLGSFHVTLDGRPVSEFESSKVRALLAFLAVESDRPHSRDVLAGLLWPNLPEQTAHARLSQALANLRRAIGDSAARPPFLKITRDSIQFNTESDHTLDVAEFTGLLTTWKSHVHRRAETCKPCADHLQAAADLYRGHFMEEFFLRGTEHFEDWLLLKRERLRRLALEALYHLSEYHERRGHHEQAYQYAARQIEIDSWREEAYRQALHALASSGRRSSALALYESIRQILKRELGAEPTAETSALNAQIKAGVLPVGPPSPGLWHNGLPISSTSFIGREEELRLIIDCLENPKRRLVTLTGPGGIGKTRLALEAATHCETSFVEGVHFVPLTALSSAEFLMPALADAVGLAFYGASEPRAQLLSYLREKDVLLILDGFERLVAKADLLADIIQHAPRIVLLITSRERLGLREEWVFDINGLQYPQSKYVDGLETYEAVNLFLRRASMVRPHFSLSPENRPHVARICQLVEGMPLAIELAAAWLPALSCKDIAQEIERGYGFLVAQQQDLAPQHHNMRVVLDRSWDLLSNVEKEMFRKFSVFRGGFSREAAERVTGASVSLLAALVDKSLVRRSSADRYEMHELLRQYANERLRENPDEEQATREGHSEYFLEFLQVRLDGLRGPRQPHAIAEIVADVENVRAAWRWAVASRRITELRSLLPNLWLFFDCRERFYEAEAAYRWTLAQLASTTKSAEPDRELTLTFHHIEAQHGWFLLRTGQYGQAKEILQRSMQVFRQLAAPQELSANLHFLGVLSWLMGEYEAAKGYLDDGMAIDREAHDSWHEALQLGSLGLVVQSLGQYDEAKRLILSALDTYRRLGDPRMIALGLGFLGPVLCALNELDEAQRTLHESLEISRILADQWVTPISLNHLGMVYFLKGQYAEARRCHLESLKLFEDIGDRAQTAVALNCLGNVATALEENDEAQQHFRKALQLGREGQYTPVALNALAGISVILAKGNDVQQERACELIGLILSHPASSQEVRDTARHVLAELGSGLSPERISAVKARGAQVGLDRVVEDILSTALSEHATHESP